MKRIATILLLLTFALASTVAGSQNKIENDVVRPPSPLTKAILQVRPSVVQVGTGYFHLPEQTKKYLEKISDWRGPFCQDPCPAFYQPMGTGFLVTEDGYVITAKHVMDTLVEQPKVSDGQGPLDFGAGSPTVRIQMPIDDGVGTIGSQPSYRGYFAGFKFEKVDEDPIHDLALLKLSANPFYERCCLEHSERPG